MNPRVAATGTELVLLLPERRRFGAGALSPTAARRLGQGDRLADGAAGEGPQLERHFRLTPTGRWPMAAITRQAEVGDAGDSAWLRADPVFLRADLGGARLMAWGNLGLTSAEAEACARALQPLFGDAGFEFSAPSPERWYLRLPRATPLPMFAAPEHGLGDDVFKHLPDGVEGRRWRALLNEAQVVLHNLPVNAARAAAGRTPTNSLWFWGGGALPDAVATDVCAVRDGDVDLRGLAVLAGIAGDDRESTSGNLLVDLRRVRDWRAIERDYLDPVPADAWAGRTSLRLDFADGAAWRLRSRQRWRLWRRPRAALGA